MKPVPLGDVVSRLIRTAHWPRSSFQIPKWQAHRGYWKGGKPQNSLASLAEARQKGALMSEFDVRLTRDYVPVLFHDEVLKIDDREVRIDEMSLSELRENAKVNTLEQILASDQVTPYLNIELKSEKILDEPLERFVAPLIEKYHAQDRVIFSSFNPFSLWKIYQYLPEVPRALLAAPDLKERSLREMWWSLVVPVHFLHLDHQMITEERMERWNRQNVLVAAWTVNEPDRMRELVSWGVKSVISDEIPPADL